MKKHKSGLIFLPIEKGDDIELWGELQVGYITLYMIWDGVGRVENQFETG